MASCPTCGGYSYHRKTMIFTWRCQSCGDEWNPPRPKTAEQIAEQIAKQEARRKTEKAEEEARRKTAELKAEQEAHYRKCCNFEQAKARWAVFERHQMYKDTGMFIPPKKNGVVHVRITEEVLRERERYFEWKQGHGITGLIDPDLEKSRLQGGGKPDICSSTGLLKKECQFCWGRMPHSPHTAVESSRSAPHLRQLGDAWYYGR